MAMYLSDIEMKVCKFKIEIERAQQNIAYKCTDEILSAWLLEQISSRNQNYTLES